MSKKPSDVFNIPELHRTTFAGIQNMLEQAKFRILPDN